MNLTMKSDQIVAPALQCWLCHTEVSQDEVTYDAVDETLEPFHPQCANWLIKHASA